MPLHVTGFGKAAADLFREYMHTDMLITLCGHPFQALDSQRAENNEHTDCLDQLLSTFEKERISGQLRFCTMAEAEASLRGTGTDSIPTVLETRDVQ